MDRFTWPFKIITKIVLARLPVPYQFWKKIGFFRHGKMDQSAYALKVFQGHIAKTFPNGLPAGFTFLELGPGDSIASALVAKSYGAKEITLVDVGDYANKDVSVYKKLARDLKAQGLNAPDIENAATFNDLLGICNARYYSQGLYALRALPAHSVDLIFSQSVLEHVRKKDFAETMRELARIVKPEGRIAHSIDFKDHLAFSLNNLRFSEKIWESDFFANSGFYTNRIRASEMLALFEQAGFDVTETHIARWESLPLPRNRMNAAFRSMSDDDLLTRHMHIGLKLGARATAGQIAA